jgi:hypoxanthine phosphoribosyltransferase
MPALPDNLKLLFTRHAIEQRLARIAADVKKSVPARERPIAVIVLQGGFIFAADLLRLLPQNYPLDVAFLRCESYGAATRSSGRVLLLQDLDQSINLHGRTVLLIDDILDTGLTMRFLVEHLKRRGARRVKICVLLHRRGAAKGRLKPHFYGFSVGRDFVVGYGLDYNGRYRHLPDLAALQPEAPRKRKAPSR